MTGRARALVATVVLAVVTAIVGGVLKVDYLALAPGPRFDTLGIAPSGKPVVSVTASSAAYHVQHPTGRLYETTVSVSDRLQIPQLVEDWFRSDRAVVPYDVIYQPNLTPAQQQQQDQQQMLDSQASAVAVALTYLKLPLGSQIAGVTPDAPAAGKLQVGDVVVAVDGRPVGAPDSFTAAVKSHRPGETLHLSVSRKCAAPISVDVVAGDDKKGHALLGVLSQPWAAQGLCITFGISPDEVGGPSAGLMMTLAIIDQLCTKQSCADLTGGGTIAGTGTIDLPSTSQSCNAVGCVGAIGGIQQKMIAARDGGAAYFLTPSANCDEASRAVPSGLKLAKVSTLQDAVDALADIRAHRDPPGC